jgi:formate hydrogenlyase transcriptional activator
VRIVAATNQDLAGMIAERRFRADLFYRLSVFPISLPPLRQRPDDIPPLVRHFVMQFAERLGRRIEIIQSEVMHALVRYPWPGNVRELQNYIERSVILSLGPVLEAPVGELLDRNPEALAPHTLKGTERAAIVRALFESNGQLTRAAVMLGVPRTTLFYKLRRLGIALPQTADRPDTADRFTGSTWSVEGSTYRRA